MRRLHPHSLWLGNTPTLWDLRGVHDEKIVVIVDLAANEMPPALTRDLTYLRFPLVDGGGNPPWLLQLAIENVTRLLKSRITTLIVCSAGMSRSPAIAAAAISCHSGTSLASALATVTEGFAHDVSPGLIAEIQAVLTSSSNAN